MHLHEGRTVSILVAPGGLKLKPTVMIFSAKLAVLPRKSIIITLSSKVKANLLQRLGFMVYNMDFAVFADSSCSFNNVGTLQTNDTPLVRNKNRG